MKETVAAFEKRTGLSYAPAEALRALGRPLGPREACPTLFRYPGPEGVRELLHGSLRRLAPAGRSGVWLSREPGGPGPPPRAVRQFGTVAVLEPLRLSPCAVQEKGMYLGANAPLHDLPGLVWAPPSLAAASVPWDRLRVPEELMRRIGAAYEKERARVLERLNRYLEELAELRRAGAPSPERPWCALPASARRTLLDRYGVSPSWTAT